MCQMCPDVSPYGLFRTVRHNVSVWHVPRAGPFGTSHIVMFRRYLGCVVSYAFLVCILTYRCHPISRIDIVGALVA